MKQILIPDVKEALVGTPRPHYLVEKALIHLLEGNKIKFAGKALFPLSDVTISDREDHVNVTAFLFTIWNASHLIKHHIGRRNFRITRLCSNHTGTCLPEEIVDFMVSVSFDEIPKEIALKIVLEKKESINSLIHGKLQATFKLGNEKIAEIECKFVGWN